MQSLAKNLVQYKRNETFPGNKRIAGSWREVFVSWDDISIDSGLDAGTTGYAGDVRALDARKMWRKASFMALVYHDKALILTSCFVNFCISFTIGFACN